jgi:hypothetical protein
VAHARLDECTSALAHARAAAAAGDESWQQWVEEYERGEALILSIDLTLVYSENGRSEVKSTSHGLFVECDLHLPKVEQQVAELAGGDFMQLAEQLAADGYQLDVDELGDMYVHVDIDEPVRRMLDAKQSVLVFDDPAETRGRNAG